MEKIKRLGLTIGFSCIATICSFLISFMLTPLITEKVGTEAYGFVTLAKNFSSYATIITIALNSYAARYITLAYHNNDYDMASRYASSVFWGDVIVAGSIFVIALVGVWYMELFLNIPTELVVSVKVLFILTFVQFFISAITTAFTSSAYIKNRLDIQSYLRVVSYVIEVIVLLYLFWTFNAEIWFVGLALVFAHLFLFIGNLIQFKKLTPELCVRIRLFSFAEVKKLVGNGLWNSINSIGNTLNSGLDLIVCNLMLTSLDMGNLAIVKTISVMFPTFYQLVSQPFQPWFLKSYSDGDTNKLLKELKLSMKISGMISGIAFAGFFALGNLFYFLWIPKQDGELIYALTVLTMITSISEGSVHPLYYIYTLTVKNRVPCIITVIGGVLNVISMYVLLAFTDMGVYAVVLTTTVIMTVINFITNPIYMTRCLSVKWKTFYPELLLNIMSCVVMCVVFKVIVGFINPADWLGLIMSAFLCACVGVVLHVLLVVRKSEIVLLWNKLKKK